MLHAVRPAAAAAVRLHAATVPERGRRPCSDVVVLSSAPSDAARETDVQPALHGPLARFCRSRNPRTRTRCVSAAIRRAPRRGERGRPELRGRCRGVRGRFGCAAAVMLKTAAAGWCRWPEFVRVVCHPHLTGPAAAPLVALAADNSDDRGTAGRLLRAHDTTRRRRARRRRGHACDLAGVSNGAGHRSRPGLCSCVPPACDSGAPGAARVLQQDALATLGPDEAQHDAHARPRQTL
mmetsp:Transcript_20872/g.62404  ORF Transcript_20872/g.62404 Transcript_20872/m.62404 type:complete len:237 (+) Transcript_20872:664-1374(+)|eukprot:356316-Chlamydomonas_euryale.AAC.4